MSCKRSKLRVGLVGCGSIARQRHLPFWRELEEESRVEIVAVCDVVDERAQEEAAQCKNARAYNKYDEMLNEVELDIVDVCTQNRLHAANAISALKKGCHVLVEKPMAMSSRECKTMIKAVEIAGTKLMVAQHMRFEAANEKLKEVIDSGEVGEIYAAQAQWLRRRGIPGWGRFHIKEESLGGPLIDIGVHMLDLTLWLMGFPTPVSASGKIYRMFGDRPDLVNASWGVGYPPKEFDVEDYATALIRFENNLTLQLSVSWAANIPEETHQIMVLGDKAGVSNNPLAVYGYDKNALTTRKYDWIPDQIGHREEIRHFTDCIEQDKPVRVLPEQSLTVQRILDAIYESSEKNREVAIRK